MTHTPRTLKPTHSDGAHKQPRTKYKAVVTQSRAPGARRRSPYPPPSATPVPAVSYAVVRAWEERCKLCQPTECAVPQRSRNMGTNGKIVDEVCRSRAQSRRVWPPACRPHNATRSISYPARRVRVGLQPSRSRSSPPWCGRALSHAHCFMLGLLILHSQATLRKVSGFYMEASSLCTGFL